MQTGNGPRRLCRRYNVPGHAHLLTFSCFKSQPLLEGDTMRILVESLELSRNRHQFELWAYVFMPEHVHLLVWPSHETYDISKFLNTFKISVSRRVINRLRREDSSQLDLLATGQQARPHRFWQDGGGHDRNLTDEDAIHARIEYIHENPVRRGLVSDQLDWMWSSAREWGKSGTGLLRIDRDSVPHRRKQPSTS